MTPNEEGDGDSEQYEVEDILAEMVQENGDGSIGRFFLIKWKGYSHDDNTWEPADNLHCPEIMRRFQERQEQSKQRRRRGRPSSSSSNGSGRKRGRPKRFPTAEATAASTATTTADMPLCSTELLASGVPTNLAKPCGIAQFFKTSTDTDSNEIDKFWTQQLLVVEEDQSHCSQVTEHSEEGDGVDGGDGDSAEEDVEADEAEEDDAEANENNAETTTTTTNKDKDKCFDSEIAFEEAMKRFKRMLARIPGPPVDICNDVDRCPPPADFIYVTEPIFGAGVSKPDASFLVGCACYVADVPGSRRRRGCCVDDTCLCLRNANQPRAYDRDGRLLPGVSVVYECNSRCCCAILSQPCRNRVIQQGRQVSLTIFRHADARGWGVRANHDIPRGTFVDVYLGEIITTTEADARFRNAHARCRPQEASYLFDLDYNYDAGQESEFTLDAYRYGNVSHFFNHSCEPNLRVCPCFTDTQDARMHSLAFFACKDIRKGDELVFDYMGGAVRGGRHVGSASSGPVGEPPSEQPCLCGAPTCRKFIYK